MMMKLLLALCSLALAAATAPTPDTTPTYVKVGSITSEPGPTDWPHDAGDTAVSVTVGSTDMPAGYETSFFMEATKCGSGDFSITSSSYGTGTVTFNVENSGTNWGASITVCASVSLYLGTTSGGTLLHTKTFSWTITTDISGTTTVTNSETTTFSFESSAASSATGTAGTNDRDATDANVVVTSQTTAVVYGTDIQVVLSATTGYCIAVTALSVTQGAGTARTTISEYLGGAPDNPQTIWFQLGPDAFLPPGSPLAVSISVTWSLGCTTRRDLLVAARAMQEQTEGHETIETVVYPVVLEDSGAVVYKIAPVALAGAAAMLL